MGYLYLTVAVFASVAKGVCGKKLSQNVASLDKVFGVSAFRMLVCVLIGGVLTLFCGDFFKVEYSVAFFAICMLSGLSVSVFSVTWLIAVKDGSYVMLNVFNMLGVLAPIILSKVFLGESVKATQASGMAFLFVAVVFLCLYNNKIKKKLTFLSSLLLAVCALANGLTDFSQKLFIRAFPLLPITAFNFYAYSVALFTLTVVWVCVKNCNGKRIDLKKVKFTKSSVWAAAMSACLFFNACFKTLAARYLQSAVLYPLHQGVALLFSVFIANAAFKEKLNAKGAVGVALALIGIFINVL